VGQLRKEYPDFASKFVKLPEKAVLRRLSPAVVDARKVRERRTRCDRGKVAPKPWRAMAYSCPCRHTGDAGAVLAAAPGDPADRADGAGVHRLGHSGDARRRPRGMGPLPAMPPRLETSLKRRQQPAWTACAAS